MKDLIVGLGLVLLGIYIAGTLIMGNNGSSMKDAGNQVGEKMINDVTQYTQP